MGCVESSQVSVDSVNRKPIRMTFLGLSKAGKSSIIEMLKNEYVCCFSNSREKMIPRFQLME